MSAINAKNRDTWQAIADRLSAQRPIPGRRVEVTGGRKHKSKIGVVLRHEVDRFDRGAWRYGSDANFHMREMAGRYGYRVQVRTDAGETFWTGGDNVRVLE